ncbi:uncharacterized protein ALTATR162_LOCUS4396 [Alternaria atra]|uniref:Uncharacterized protein n=1 Tax=Alternaria atra TaxID=119953 RepID=A0A8J2I860_9PLEO|nr:uncharacterized protein ALTATR162_LOCUS4396 [Alternaria atra]CAG5156599.1 unnamed protein product [Alternaria atra]
MSSAQPSSADLQAYSEKLQAFYHNLPDLPEDQPDKIETEALEQDVKKLDVKEPTLEDKVNAYYHPVEQGVAGSLTDKIAKESSDSTASSHANHADIQAHNSKGPVIPDNMPKAESKEDLKKRAEELNK